MDIVKLTWRDSNMYLLQCDIDGEFPTAEIVSIGYVIQDNEENIVIAGDIIGDEARRVISIPKENIKENTLLT